MQATEIVLLFNHVAGDIESITLGEIVTVKFNSQCHKAHVCMCVCMCTYVRLHVVCVCACDVM